MTHWVVMHMMVNMIEHIVFKIIKNQRIQLTFIIYKHNC
jgi:hypothetical protein